MTAEVDVFESESAKLAVAEEQQCSLDLANANGVVHGISKDDADCSYVFVTGTDVKDDHLAADLDLSTQLNDENGEALQSHFENNGGHGFNCETGASATKDENRINADAKAAEHMVETPVSEASGCNYEPPLQHSDAKVEVEGGEAIHGLEAHEREESEISINNNFQILPSQAKSKSNSVLDADEYEESDISISVDNNFSSVTSQDKEQSSEPGDCGDDMEQDSRTAPYLEADIKLATIINNGSVSDDIGDNIKQPTVLEIEVENGTSCPANDARSEAETCHDSIEGEEKVNNDALDIEPGVSNRVVTDGTAIQLMSGSRTDVGWHLDTSVDKNCGSPASISVDFKSECEAENAYALNGTSIPGEDAIVSESEDLHSLAVPAVDSGSDFVNGESNVKPTCQEEAEIIDEIHGDEASTSSPEDNLKGQNVGWHIDTSVDDDGGSTVSQIIDLKPESEVENTYALDDRNMSGDDGIVSEDRDLHNPSVDSGSDFVRVENGDKPKSQEAESIDGIHGDEASTSSPEDNLEEQNVARHIDTSVDKNGGSRASLSVDFNPESETEIENTYTLDSKNMSGEDAIVTESRDLHNPPEDSGSDFVHVEGDVKLTCENTESNDGIHEDKALTSSPKDNLGGLNVGQHLDTSVDNDGGSPDSVIVDFELESALDNRNMSADDGVVSEARDLHNPSVDSGSDFVRVENGDKPTSQEAESIDGIHGDGASTSSPEDSLEGQNVARHIDTSVDKNGGSRASLSVDFNPESETEIENTYTLDSKNMSGEDAIVTESRDLHNPPEDSGSDFVHVEGDVKLTRENTESNDGIHEDKALTSSPKDNLGGLNVGQHLDSSVDNDGGSPDSLIVDFEPESALDNRNMSADDGVVSEARDLHNPSVDSGSDFVRVENGDKPTSQEAESSDGIHGDEASTSSPEDSLEGQNVARHIDTSVDKNGGSRASLSVDFNPESETEIENTYTLDSKNMSGEDAIVTESRDLHNPPEDSGSAFVHVEGDVKLTCENTESNDGIHEDKALTSSPKDNLGGLNVGQHLDTSVDNDGGSPDSVIVDFEPESALDNRNMSADDGVVSESRDLHSPPEDGGIALDSKLEFVHAESDVKQTCQEAESIDGIPRDEASKSSPENNLEVLDAGVEVVKRPFYFLIRIPRYDDENLREQIKLAQLHVEEKTKSRDAIRAKIQMKRATCKQYDGDVQSALTEERAARDSFKSKRHEMDSVQFMINKVKNAISVEDIDGRIRNMEHMIEHETLPLREEKQLIREIKQLKQLREQLSSSIGKQDEIRQALDQKDQIEERLKVLRKEFDLLKEKLLKAEAVTQAARKIFNDENVGLIELQSHFKAADGIRQEAYTHLQNLKKQQYEKNKYFWRYKDDAKAASTLASSGDKEQLQQLCVDQVERIMEIWNKDDDFRKEYTRCNTRSTLRRLRTLDGRSLGPDEEPPAISYMVNDRLKTNNSVAPTSTLEQEKQVAPVKAEIPDKSAAKVEEGENKKTKTKNPAKHASSENGPTTISGWVEVEAEREEENKLTKEEEELARKAEELRKEEAAAKLKEQRRLEGKAKSKEGQERRKRIAEKTQARAAIKAQKEAEEKQKEKEKRAMKKERKKANATEATNGVGDEGDSALAPSFNGTPKEEAEESETKENLKTTSKRPQKASQFTKQTRGNPIPLPLRNRNKRRMQPWMWVVVAVLAVSALFLVGNSNLSFEFWLHWLGF